MLLEQLWHLPLVAILRGITPDEVVEHGQALISAGFKIIEVPLNSPEPWQTIRLLQEEFGDEALIGAGTVLTLEDVDQLADTGAKLMVCPHTDVALIRHAKAKGLYALPGFFTASEAFAALFAGADALKLFPAECLPDAKAVKAMRAVIPHTIPILPVGGISPFGMDSYMAVGASGFGLGSALYKAGQNVQSTRDNAEQFVSAWQALQEGK